MYYVNESNGIDLKDEFAVYEFDTTDYRLPEDESKVDEKRVLQDLQRVFVVIRNHGKPYVICKQIDYINPYNILEFIRFSTFKNRLKDRKTKGKPLIFSVYNNYSDLLLKEDITFNGNNPYYFKYFQGFYNRNILPNYNPEIIAEYLKYIKEVIANEDIELYNYILNWISFFVQNPGQRTKKALVITGRDWDNKRIFGRILCRMIEPYSKHYVGIWNGCQMLVVFDEITLPKAKKLIIDDYVTVNEYCRPKRTVENVANLIIINDKIANRVKNDKDFVVLTVSDKYLKNRTYPDDLLKKFGFNDWNCIKTDAGDVFLDNLLTFFLKKDLTGFNVNESPKNESNS